MKRKELVQIIDEKKNKREISPEKRSALIYELYEKKRREEREKKVLLDLFILATEGKDLILKKGK